MPPPDPRRRQGVLRAPGDEGRSPSVCAGRGLHVLRLAPWLLRAPGAMELRTRLHHCPGRRDARQRIRAVVSGRLLAHPCAPDGAPACSSSPDGCSAPRRHGARDASPPLLRPDRTLAMGHLQLLL